MRRHEAEASIRMRPEDDLGQTRPPRVPFKITDADFLLESDPHDTSFRDTRVHTGADISIGASVRSTIRGIRNIESGGRR